MTDSPLLDDRLAALATEVARDAVARARAQDTAEPVPLRRRRGAVVLGGTALALLGGAGVAAAVTWSAHTGVFGQPGFTENDTSEYLDTGAPDFPQVLRSLQPTDLRLPEGESFEPFLESDVASLRREPTVVQVTGERAKFVFYATCRWQAAWLDTPSSQAVAQLRELADRPELRAVDGDGVVERRRALAEAAARGERVPVAQEVADNCQGWVR